MPVVSHSIASIATVSAPTHDVLFELAGKVELSEWRRVYPGISFTSGKPMRFARIVE
jgi:hypothetical protein